MGKSTELISSGVSPPMLKDRCVPVVEKASLLFFSAFFAIIRLRRAKLLRIRGIVGD
jgi:hypothetical protein